MLTNESCTVKYTKLYVNTSTKQEQNKLIRKLPFIKKTTSFFLNNRNVTEHKNKYIELKQKQINATVLQLLQLNLLYSL